MSNKVILSSQQIEDLRAIFKGSAIDRYIIWNNVVAGQDQSEFIRGSVIKYSKKSKSLFKKYIDYLMSEKIDFYNIFFNTNSNPRMISKIV